MSADPIAQSAVPRHVAIIMDGNGRWAERHHRPRMAGHKAGVEAVREVIRGCAEHGVEVLTLFAFSTENWRRPAEEVGWLMHLFLTALKREVRRLHERGIALRVIGDRSRFGTELREQIEQAERLTRSNDRLTLVIAANYGGRDEIVRVSQRLAAAAAAGELAPEAIDEARFSAELALADLPEIDLFIRTGGEQRISNFLLWQLAYAELYFTDRLWPDFDVEALSEAIASFASRQRRFGRTGQQVAQAAQGAG